MDTLVVTRRSLTLPIHGKQAISFSDSEAPSVANMPTYCSFCACGSRLEYFEPLLMMN